MDYTILAEDYEQRKNDVEFKILKLESEIEKEKRALEHLKFSNIKKRYLNDAKFHSVVDMLVAMMLEKTFTAVDLQEALLYACKFHLNIEVPERTITDHYLNTEIRVTKNFHAQAVNSASLLLQVEKAIENYYSALDYRKHGGSSTDIAQDTAMYEIQKILGMHWEQGKIKKEREARLTGDFQQEKPDDVMARMGYPADKEKDDH